MSAAERAGVAVDLVTRAMRILEERAAFCRSEAANRESHGIARAAEMWSTRALEDEWIADLFWREMGAGGS